MQMFGSKAVKQLNYVECFPDGYRKGTKIAKACSDAKIEGFPTWVINGQVRILFVLAYEFSLYQALGNSFSNLCHHTWSFFCNWTFWLHSHPLKVFIVGSQWRARPVRPRQGIWLSRNESAQLNNSGILLVHMYILYEYRLILMLSKHVFPSVILFLYMSGLDKSRQCGAILSPSVCTQLTSDCHHLYVYGWH